MKEIPESRNKIPSKITLDFIEEIQTKDKRIVDFLGEEIIVNKNVFPVDSPCSYSSTITARAIESPYKSVLDIGTGTGVQAIIAAKRGAKNVLAVDIDEKALENARENIFHHQLEHIIEVRKSDLFENIQQGEVFDLIIAQLPFVDSNYKSSLSHFLFDSGFVLHEKFLRLAKKYLTADGKIYIPSGEIANEEKLKKLIDKYNYKIEDIRQELHNNIIRSLYILMRC